MRTRQILSAAAHYYTIAAVTVVSVVAALLVANLAAQSYLRGSPELLMTEADRINENTRVVRERMVPPDKAMLWYDLASVDEVKPLWDEYYTAGLEFESYTHFRSRKLVGRYYGTTEAGYRMTREQGPWPPNSANFNVFFFGGSTSFGVGPYWATVASYLQDTMNASQSFGRRVQVYNFGRTGYHLSQEVVLFQRLLASGHVPNMVVFLDGLNDLCWTDGNPSSWQMLAGYFNETNESYRRQFAGYGVATRWDQARSFLNSLPIVRLVNAWQERMRSAPIPKYVPPEQAIEEKPESREVLNSVLTRYISIKKQIEAISRDFEIAPIFVWQPVPHYKYDLSYHLFNPDRLGCHVNSKFGYPMMAERVAREGLGASFLWAADMQQDLKEPLYIDAFHYTAPMSKRIAELIFHAVRERSPSKEMGK